MGDGEMNEPEWMVKKREYEQRMARVKNAKLRTLCTICSALRAPFCLRNP